MRFFSNQKFDTLCDKFRKLDKFKKFPKLESLSFAATIGVFLLSIAQYHSSEITSKRQLRAYLGIEFKEILCSSCGPYKSGEWVVQDGRTAKNMEVALTKNADGLIFSIKNAGQTPAYNVSVCMAWSPRGLMDNSTVAPDDELICKTTKNNFSGPTMILPGVEGNYIYALPPSVMSELLQSERKARFSGTVHFKDIFGEQRTPIPFCATFSASDQIKFSVCPEHSTNFE